MLVDSMNFTEFYDFDVTGMKRTSEGYIIAKPRVARTGIQHYLGSELGRNDMETVAVYRPENEVFHKDSMKTLAHRPITFGHPTEMVDSKNFRQYQIGMSGDEVVRDGDCIRVSMMVMDADAAEKAKELSVGYSSEIVWGAGVTDSGEKYDATQRKIKANHIAIVPQARGGHRLRLGDNNNGVSTMVERVQMTQNLMVDGLEVTLEARDAAIVQRHIKQLSDEATTLRDAAAKTAKQLADVQAELATATAAVAAKDGEILVLKKEVTDSKLSPEALDKYVADRAIVVDGAKRILGDTYTGQGKTDAQIKREAVEKHLGDAAKGIADAAVDGAFLAIVAKTGDTETRRLGNALSQTVTRTADAASSEKAWHDRNARMTDAWKGPQVATQQ